MLLLEASPAFLIAFLMLQITSGRTESTLELRQRHLRNCKSSIALRPMRPKEGDLWGRKLADVAWAIYGAVGYLDERGETVPSLEHLGRHGVIGWEDAAAGI